MRLHAANHSPRILPGTRRARAIGITAVIVAAGCLSFVLSGSRSERIQPPATMRHVADNRAPTGSLDAGTINPTLRRAFAVFRERPEPTHANTAVVATSSLSAFSELLPKLVNHWADGSSTTLGEASAQNLEEMTVDGTQFALLAGTDGACMAAATTLMPGGRGGLTAVCGSADSVADRGLGFQTGNSSGSSTFVGIVPSNNGSVDVSLASGATETVPVVSNAYSVTSSSQSSIASVSYNASNGSRVTIAAHAG